MENAYVLQLSDSKFKDLFLISCGYAQCQPYHSYGPAVRPNYIIHFILKGKGIYQVGEKKYALSAGQGFLIEPEVATFYAADGTDPWEYLWVGFGGIQAGEYLRDLGLNSSQLIFQSENGQELGQVVLKMMQQDSTSVKSNYLRQSFLYEFFSILAEEYTYGKTEETSKENAYIAWALHYIRNHYAAGIKVSDIARELCVDRSYLYKLFEGTLQMSPQEFLTQFRISRSKELLNMTELSVAEVSASCGYGDVRVFSRAFKKETGCPPTRYRKECKREVQRKLKELGKDVGEIITGKP